MSLHDDAMAVFCAAWRAAHGKAYVAMPADRSQLGRLLKNPLWLAEIGPGWAETCRRYCADREDFVLRGSGQHSLKYLCTTGLNKYRAPIMSRQAISATLDAAHATRKAKAAARRPAVRSSEPTPLDVLLGEMPEWMH